MQGVIQMDQITPIRPKKEIKNITQTTWVFDLDNTLYPDHCNLFANIDVKMKAYISSLLGVGTDEAHKIQKDFFIDYGTTLRGLIDVHGVDPREFLDFVHNIDLSPLQEDKALRQALQDIRGSKFVFTNGDTRYAQRVLEKIGIDQEFDGVFDITLADHVPKPNAAAYQNFIRHFDIDPKSAVMIEDMARNLKPAAALGMTTVWLKTAYPWGEIGYDTAHIDYETDHLVSWLEGVL